jgi:acyl-homoserine lactone acylase PvdQ
VRTGAFIAVAGVLALLPATAGAAKDPGFRNVLPGGQGETVNAAELAAAQATGQPPYSFTSQLGPYTGLVGAAPTLKRSDLDRYFKPEIFGVPRGEVASTVTPRPGVRIERDRTHLVPHVTATTRSGVMFGAGYASAQDRLFFMDVLRHTARARLTELIGTGEGDATVKMDAEQLKIADYSEQELEEMLDSAREAAGPEGPAIQADLDAYVAGVNHYIAEARLDPTKMPAEYPALGKLPRDWRATDTVAIASLIGGIFGKGGGGEARAAQALRAAQARFGPEDGRKVFEDFRTAEDPEAPVTTTTTFPFDDPGPVDPAAVALPDLDSYEDRDPVVSSVDSVGLRPTNSTLGPPRWLERMRRDGLALQRTQSNALLVGAASSASGHPIAVMGPQVGYYSPEVLMELDLHGGGIDARGATFPGISLYVLIGRGRDFAWSTTTAYSDNVDEFAERLCEPDGSAPTRKSRHYVHDGACIPLETREHVIQTTPAPTDPQPPRTIRMEVMRSVHGPIQGTATVDGAPVAIAEARSTYGHEVDSVRAYKRMNAGEVTDPASFQQAMALNNFAFNHFYADARHIAYITSGWYPERGAGVDPSLPAWGTGRWDWRSDRLPFERLPKEVDPPRGWFANWNNKQAPGWRAADDNFTFGPVQRSQRLEARIRAGLANGAKLDLTKLTQAMEDAATVDLRGQQSYPLLRRASGASQDPAVAEPLRLLDEWARDGGHRRDLDGDGVYEQSAAVALMDAWWERLVPGMFEPALGAPLVQSLRAVNPFAQVPDGGGSSFWAGWHGYVDKDLRSLLGDPVQRPLSRPYCGGGALDACRAVLTSALAAAADDVRRDYGTDLAGVRIRSSGCKDDPICDQIEFTTAGAVETDPIPWQDRPTFQQVVELR